MKQICLLTTLFAFATLFSLGAQTTQGSVSLGLHNFSPLFSETGGLLAPSNALGIAITTSKSEQDGVKDPLETKNTTIGLSASAHYFLINNLSAGLNLSLLNQKAKTTGGLEDYEQTVTIFMAGPELRYFISAGDKSKIRINAETAFGTSKAEYNGDSSNDANNLSRFSGGAGFVFFPNEHMSIDLGVGYGAFIVKSEYTNILDEKVKSKDTNNGVTLDVGFSVYF